NLLAAETSAVALGAARGTPCPPLFEGCSPSPLAPSYAFAAAADVFIAEDVGAASAGAKRRSSKGKGGKGGGGGSGGGGGGSGRSGGGSSGGGGGGGTGGGSGGSGGGGGGNSGSGGSGGSGTGGGGTGAQRVGFGGGQHQQQQRWSETQSPQQLREWFLRGASEDLLMSKIAIFDLDFDVILSAMYALSVSAEGECYRCVPPDLGIAAVALGASESGTLPVTAPSQALHTFMLDSGAFACFFRDTPLSLLSLHLSWSSPPLVLYELGEYRCPPGCDGSSLYTLATEPPQVAASAQVSASVQVAASCSCRLLSHQTMAPPPGSPVPATPSWHALSSSCLWSSQVPASPPALACLALPSLRRRAASRERYFLLIVDDYTRYTTVFPLRSKNQVVDVLIPWIRTLRLQLHERFGKDLPVLHLHSDRGGEFSSDLLWDFCRGDGIL
ncbi:unnamed protein product, partial [Closterium sp. NIES-53]